MTDGQDGYIVGSTISGIYHTDCMTKLCDQHFKIIKKHLPVLTAYRSEDNTYWIGSFQSSEGIINIDESGKTLLNLSNYLKDKFGISKSAGACFSEINSNEIWIGTNADGLFRVSIDNKQKKYLVLKDIPTAEKKIKT